MPLESATYGSYHPLAVPAFSPSLHPQIISDVCPFPEPVRRQLSRLAQDHFHIGSWWPHMSIELYRLYCSHSQERPHFPQTVGSASFFLRAPWLKKQAYNILSPISVLFPFLLGGELSAAVSRSQRRQLQSDDHAGKRAGFSQQDAGSSGEGPDRARAEGFRDRRPQEGKVPCLCFRHD